MTNMHSWSFIKNNDSVKLIKDMLSEFNLITSIPLDSLPRCISDNKLRILFTLACRCSFPTSVSIFDRIHSTFIYKIIFQLHPLHMPQNKCTKQFFRCWRGKWRSWVENENCRWHKYCNIYKSGQFRWEMMLILLILIMLCWKNDCYRLIGSSGQNNLGWLRHTWILLLWQNDFILAIPAHPLP